MYCLCSISLSWSCCREIGAPGAGLGKAMDGVHHEVKAVQVIEHRHVERRRDRALFLVAADMIVGVVGPAIGQPVNQPG